MGQIPTNDKDTKGIPASFSLDFHPGGVDDQFPIFSDLVNLRTFIEQNIDAEISLLNDFSLVGDLFTLPAGGYKFDRIDNRGQLNPATSDRPTLAFGVGAVINAADNDITGTQIIYRNDSPGVVWAPTDNMTITLDRGRLVQNSTGLFADLTGAASNFTIVDLGRGTRIENVTGEPLFHVKSGATFAIFGNNDAVIDADIVSSEDLTSTVLVELSPNARIGPQTLVDPSQLQIIGPEQSGAAAERPDLTYVGKTWWNTDTGQFEVWDGTQWVAINGATNIFNILILLGVVPQILTGSPNPVVTTVAPAADINSAVTLLPATDYLVTISYSFNHDSTTQDFVALCAVGATILGTPSVAGVREIHREEVKDASNGGTEQIPGTGSNQRYAFQKSYPYNSGAGGIVPVILVHLSSGFQEASMWDAVIKFERVQ